MRADPKRDFASLLDDLFVTSHDEADSPEEADDEPVLRPSLNFDYLAVAEELHSGRIQVSGGAAEAEYRESGASIEAELAALLAEADVSQAAEELPPVEPEAIATELGLTPKSSVTDLGRLRRDFAFKNHPDRVAPHLRQRAMVRMQVANMLIDDAKRRARKG